MKMQGPLFKIYEKFQNTDNRAIKQVRGILSAEFWAAQVVRPLSWPGSYTQHSFPSGSKHTQGLHALLCSFLMGPEVYPLVSH